MARIRSIHPGAPLDEEVATMSVHARLVWAYLPCFADREGRLKDSAFTLKASILPGDEDVDMSQILDELAQRKHIVRYEVDGRRFIEIRSFKRYQNPHKNELPSTIPAPWDSLASARDKTGEVHEETGTAPADQIRSGSGSDSRSESTSGSGGVGGEVVIAPRRETKPEATERRPFPHVGAATPAFFRVFDRYPRKDAKNEAAAAFQEIAGAHPGGEEALADAIVAAFDAGMLARAPYAGPNDKRPFLWRVILNRRWEDPPSAPDEPVRPTQESFAERDARVARERAERDQRKIDHDVAATEQKLARDRNFTPPTPEQQEEIRRGLIELADKKSAVGSSPSRLRTKGDH